MSIFTRITKEYHHEMMTMGGGSIRAHRDKAISPKS